MKKLQLEFAHIDPPAAAVQAWRERYNRWLKTRRYEEIMVGPDRVEYERSYVPGVCILLAIFMFPIGLLALFVKSTARLSVSFEPRTDKSVIVKVSGHGGARLMREFRELEMESNSNVIQMEQGGPTPPLVDTLPVGSDELDRP